MPPSDTEPDDEQLLADDDSHPIPCVTALDVHAIGPDGRCELHLMVPASLTPDRRSCLRLLRKLRNYVAFVSGPEFRATYGAPSLDTTSIIVALPSPVDQNILKVVESQRWDVEHNRARLVLQVDGSTVPLKVRTIDSPAGPIPLTQPALKGPDQEFVPVDGAALRLLNGEAARCRSFVATFSRHRRRPTLADLDAAFARWNVRRSAGPADDVVMAILGAGLGSCCARSLSMQWVVIKDVLGEAFALRHDATGVLTCPFGSVQRRIDHFEPDAIQHLYYAVRHAAGEDRTGPDNPPVVAIYDDASWHRDDVRAAGLPDAASGTPTALFLAWAVGAGLAAEGPVDEYRTLRPRLVARSMSPGDFFIDACACELNDEHLSDEGNDFASWYHAGGGFIHDLTAGLAADQPSIYHVPDTWESLDRLSPTLDARLQEWRALPIAAPRPWWKFW